MKILLLLALIPVLSIAAPAPKAPKAVAPSAPAGVALKSAEGGSVNFLAVGKPSALKIHGKAPGPAAKLKLEGEKLAGEAEFDMTQLDTGINLRNEHMKDKYLQVKEHPKAKLTLTDAAVDPGFAGSLSNAGEKPFKGKLSLHGKENDVAGTYTAKDGKVDAKFQLKLTDYAIEIPSYLGITVAELVDVNVTLPLAKE